MKDEATVVSSSVVCVIGAGIDTRSVVLKNSSATPDLYEGQFDTRTLKVSPPRLTRGFIRKV